MESLFCKSLLAICLFSAPVMSVAQVIRGSVADAASGEPLPTAVVFVVGQEDKGVSTDFDGNFVLANVVSGVRPSWRVSWATSLSSSRR